MDTTSFQFSSLQGFSGHDRESQTIKPRVKAATKQGQKLRNPENPGHHTGLEDRTIKARYHSCYFSEAKDTFPVLTENAVSSVCNWFGAHSSSHDVMNPPVFPGNTLVTIEKNKETGLLAYPEELDLGSAWKTYTEMQYCFSAKDIEFAICQLKALMNTKAFIDLEKNKYSTPVDLWPEHLLKIACSDIIITKEGSKPTDFHSLDSTSLRQYLNSLKHRVQAYHEVYPFKKVPLELQHPLNSFWWENNTPEKYNLDSNELEKLKQYFYDICIPHRLGGVIFKNPTTWSYPDALIHMDHHVPDSSGLQPDKILNGDEFEYWAGKAPHQGTNERIIELLDRLDLHAKKVAESINVTEQEFSTTRDLYPDDFKRSMYRGRPRLTISFGAWECVAHWDYWSAEPLFEINPSPYKINEQYLVNDKKFSVYDIYDLFITSFAKQEGLEPSSGHKHIDFHESIGGNPEFLFRLFVSAEQNSFLSHVFKTEEYSDESNQYVSQSKKSLCKIRALKSMVNAFNHWIKLGYTGKSGDHFSVNECFRHFWSGLFASTTSK